jgi:ubiquinone/menaquinone biosynthesis C-methylase UbiE
MTASSKDPDRTTIGHSIDQSLADESQQNSDVLAHNVRGYKRLSEQAQIWEAATARALDHVHLGHATHALDVGCGTGEVMRLLAKRVGQFGMVTGVDNDALLGATVLAPLRNASPDLYRFIAGDVRDMPSITGGPFDLVFSRLLLIRMEHPEALLSKLWDWVRPGGSLLVMDYDFTSARSTPQQPIIERSLRLLIEALRREGRDIEIGSRLPELFVEAGIGEPDGCEVNGVILPCAQSIPMLLETIAGLRSVITEMRLADNPALDRLERELNAAIDAPVFIRWPDMVASWKRKPE